VILTEWFLVRLLASDQRVRYLCAGGVAAAVFYATFAAGWAFLSRWIPYLVIAVGANMITALATYPIYRRIVFRVAGPWLTGFLRFYVLCVGSLLVVFGGLPLLVEVVGLHVLVAQAIVLVGSPVINYQVGQLWAFRQRNVAALSPAHVGVDQAVGLRACTTKPLATTLASGCRANTRSISLRGDNAHISGPSSR
jgi:putative flippase GtrA